MATLSERLESNETVIGSFIGIGNPVVVEIAGSAGFDFVVIDLEHACMSVETVENMIRAASVVGIDAIVRVPNVEDALVGKLLDAGATGVQVPQVISRKQAEMAVAAAKYPPSGTRGYMPVSRASRFLRNSKEEHIAKSNSESLVVVQVEGVEGLSAIDEILKTPGLSVVFLGPYDLSMSLGVPGQVNHLSVCGAMCKVIKKAQAAGVRVGVFADDPDGARRWIEQGVNYITVGLDVSYLSNAFRRCMVDIKGA